MVQASRMLCLNVKLLGLCTIAAGSALAILPGDNSRTGLTSPRYVPSNRMSRLPRVTLWAWERREDLSFIDPQKIGIAYLASTIYLSGDRVMIRPRQQPLIAPHDAILIPVVRIETSRRSAPTMSPRQRAGVLEAIARFADHSTAAIQVDFDATRSQRGFYRELLTDLSSRLPPSTALSITALASWCLYDDWIGGLPVDEAVPMLFRMGADSAEIATYLRRGGDFVPAISRSSVGVAIDEPAITAPAGRRIYLFSPHAWTRTDAAKAIAEVMK